jgi:hypothetical protein
MEEEGLTANCLSASYPIYGNDTKLRSTEDIAFAVALFIARKRGSFVSYYMVGIS